MKLSHLGAVILTTATSCTGYITDPAGDQVAGGQQVGGTPGGPVSDPGIVVTGPCQEEVPGVTAARRLTRSQYANILRDLQLDPDGAAATELPIDDAGDEVAPNPRAIVVTPDWAASAMAAAEVAAKAAVASLPSVLRCDPTTTGESACAQQFITDFGKRAYRRPLEDSEVAGLMTVFGVGSQNGGFERGIEVVVRAILQSPSFLYLLELGQSSGSSATSIRLTPYEVASRLSFLFWDSIPDDQLLTAAANNQLATREQIAAQARRMLADSKAQAPLARFHRKWLGVDSLIDAAKDVEKYPAFSEDLITSMRSELDLYVADVLFQGDGRLQTLFGSNFTYVDSLLAPLYGVPEPANGFARVNLDPTQRAGILTNVGVIASHTLADESQAIHRGRFVRERLLCSPLPEPPPTLVVNPPEPEPGVSTRERLRQHSSEAACQGCHRMMDPIGFGFEAYDSLGRFRTTDPNGQPVDTSGVLEQTDVDGPFNGAVELGQKLASSAQVRACVASTLLRYARGPEADSDACLREKLVTAFDAANHDIREILIAITQTDGFSFRRPIEGEVLP